MEVFSTPVATRSPGTRAPGRDTGSNGWRVLLVEDDEAIADLALDFLREQGMDVIWIEDGRCGLAEALEGDYDVVLLDLMLPGLDGVEVCRHLRACSSVPVLMLTARGDEDDRVFGLDAGADDYIVKPFSCRELVARMRAVVRRHRGAEPRAVLDAGPLHLDLSRRHVRFRGRTIDLTAHEFDILTLLAEHPGRVLRREQIRTALSPAGDVSARVIDVHVSRIRTKLGEPPRRPRLLKTVWGVGYVLELDPEPDPEPDPQRGVP